MTALDAGEVINFLKAAQETPHYVVFYTALFTGLRRSELVGLRWGDVDVDLARLSVVRTLHRLKSGELVFAEPKSRRSRRVVDLPPSLAVLLRHHREKQEENRWLLGSTLSEADLVFSHPDGTPVDPHSISQAFRRLAKSLNLPTTRFHDLRHTHATLLLQQGVYPKVVSERLGRSSVAVTLDTYSHKVPSLQESAARRFDEALQVAVGELQAMDVIKIDGCGWWA